MFILCTFRSKHGGKNIVLHTIKASINIQVKEIEAIRMPCSGLSPPLRLTALCGSTAVRILSRSPVATGYDSFSRGSNLETNEIFSAGCARAL